MRHPVIALATVALLVASACGGHSEADSSPDPSGRPQVATASASPSPSPEPTVDPEGELCQLIGDLGLRLATVQSVELTLPNRTSLEIELDKLMATHEELERSDLGDREAEMEDSLTRLGYRMRELELAVEDFRTSSRPRRAAPHVEEDARKVANELTAFVVLSRC
jgi:hypothetical protein